MVSAIVLELIAASIVDVMGIGIGAPDHPAGRGDINVLNCARGGREPAERTVSSEPSPSPLGLKGATQRGCLRVSIGRLQASGGNEGFDPGARWVTTLGGLSRRTAHNPDR